MSRIREFHELRIAKDDIFFFIYHFSFFIYHFSSLCFNLGGGLSELIANCCLCPFVLTCGRQRNCWTLYRGKKLIFKMEGHYCYLRGLLARSVRRAGQTVFTELLKEGGA